MTAVRSSALCLLPLLTKQYWPDAALHIQSANGPLNSKPAKSHTTLYIIAHLHCEPVTGLLYQFWNAYQAPSHADGNDRLVCRGMHNSSHTLPELLEQKCRSKECVPDQVALVKLTGVEGYRRHPEGLRRVTTRSIRYCTQRMTALKTIMASRCTCCNHAAQERSCLSYTMGNVNKAML